MMRTLGTPHMVAITSIVVLGFTLAVVAPGHRELQETRRLIASEQAVAETEQAEASRLAPLYAELSGFASRAGDFERAVPNEHRFAAAFESLRQFCAESGIVQQVLRPGRARTWSAGLRARAPAGSPEIMIHPVHVELTGRMASVFEFLRRVEAWERLTSIDRLRLERVGEADQVHCEVTLDLFYTAPRSPRTTPAPAENRNKLVQR